MRNTGTSAGLFGGMRQTTAAVLCLSLLSWGCSPEAYRRQADKAAADIIAQKQMEALGRTEPFTIEKPEETLRRRLFVDQGLVASAPASIDSACVETPKGWPAEPGEPRVPAEGESSAGGGGEAPAVALTLFEALEVAAANSRDYQGRKEDVFRTALSLDLERDDFRSTFAGAMDAVFSNDMSSGRPSNAVDSTTDLSWSKVFKSGASVTTGIALDLVKLLTGTRDDSLGLSTDASIGIPLMRGAGRRIVAEPLTQAERSVVYSINDFERYKRTFVVRVASDYLAVLQRLDQIRNAEENYRSLITSGRRAKRLADAGRLPEIQVDQARQNELSARDRWISARAAYERTLDSFKLTLGLPTDARMELDRDELQRLADVAREALGGSAELSGFESSEPAEEETTADEPVVLEEPERNVGPYELEEEVAVAIAFENRLDLRNSLGGVYDAQRKVIVAADALRAGLNLNASGSWGERRGRGSASSDNVKLRFDEGSHNVSLSLDLPWERTSQRNSYRNSLISYERSVRDFQDSEDRVKLDVRNALRNLLSSREAIKIQLVAVRVAERRVDSTQLFLEAGRAETRDLLEARESLVSAQDALTSNLVSYRVAELELQRDMGVLQVNEKGIWHEYETGKVRTVPETQD